MILPGFSFRPLTFAIVLTLAACSSPLDSDELLIRAHQAADKGQWNAAEVDIKQALQHEPDNPAGRRLLGEVYFQQRLFAEAATELDRSLTAEVDPDTLILYAQSLQAAGDSPRLISLYQSDYFDLAGDDPVLLATLSLAQLTLGNLDSAHSFLKAAQAREQDRPEIRLVQALITLNTSADLNEVARILQRLTDTFPDYDEGWSLAGYLALTQANLAQAAAAFDRSVRLNPYRLEDHLLRVNSLLDLGDLELANRELQAAARKAPQHPGVYFARARLLLESDKAEEALEQLQKILALDPDHKPSLYLAGAANVSAGNPTTALGQLSQFVTAHPHHVGARLLQGRVYLQLNDKESARVVAQKLLAEYPENMAARVLLAETGDNPLSAGLMALHAGREALLKNDLALAHQHFIAALELDPALMEARQALVGIAMAEGDIDRAIEIVADGLQRQPDNLPGLLNLAAIHAQTGDESSTVAVLQRAVEIHPDALEPRLVLGRHLLHQGDLNAALVLLEGAQELHPGEDALHRLLMAAYLAAGQPDQAAVSGQMLLTLVPDHPQVLQLMAHIEKARQDPAAVEHYLRRLLDLQPDNVQARQELVEALLLQGKVAEAGQQFELFPDGLLGSSELKLIQGRIAIALGERQRGQALLREAYTQSPSQYTLSQLASTLAREDTTRSEAIALLQTWLETNPQDEMVLGLLQSLKDGG